MFAVGAGLATESGSGSKHEEQVLSELNKRLRGVLPNTDLRTCADFAHLGVDCCPICHFDYPEFELALVEIESGGRAWLCCALDRTLNPSKQAAMERN
jgi:hypothetical protein